MYVSVGTADSLIQEYQERTGDMLCGLLVTHQSIKELPGVALFLDFRYKVCV